MLDHYRSAEDFSKAVSNASRQARRLPDFLVWVDEVIEARRSVLERDREELYKMKEFRDPWKFFFEELFPLANWLKSRPDLAPGTIVQPTLSSVPPDAVLTSPDGQTLNVEVVKERNGWLEDLQSETMRRFGFSPLTPRGGVAGMKAALAMDQRPEMEAVDSQDAFAQLQRYLESGISKKASKRQYQTLQPIILLAVTEDIFGEQLKDFAADLTIPDQHPFQEIYLVSTNLPKSLRVFPKNEETLSYN